MRYDVMIVGGGPAGLTCGFFCARIGLKVVLFEALGAGGQLINVHRLDDYPGLPVGIAGWDLGVALNQQAIDSGVEFRYGSVTEIAPTSEGWTVRSSDGQCESTALVVSTGGNPRALAIPGEKKLEGRGVSYCAGCDGEFFRDQPVAVVGGGDIAMSEAVFLSDIASQVHVICEASELQASEAWRLQAQKQDNLAIEFNSRIEEIFGDDAVSAIKLLDISTGERHKLDVAGVFGAIGIEPNTEFVGSLLETDAEGFLVTDDNLRCSRKGVYAAGDVRAGAVDRAAAAVGDGVRCAYAVASFVRDRGGPPPK